MATLLPFWAFCSSNELGTAGLLPQLLQQHLSLLEIGGVKPLGEPRIHRGQQVVGGLALVLGLPQASQAGGSTELPRFGVLLTGDVDGFAKTGFRFGLGAGVFRRIWTCVRRGWDGSETGRRLLQRQLPLEAVEFSFGRELGRVEARARSYSPDG